MREIKFIVWDKALRCMRYLSYPHDTLMFDEKGAYYYNLENGDGNSCKECGYGELMQYTGIKDKNGKEIYEGDIVKVEDWYMGKIFNVFTYEVKFGKYDQDGSGDEYEPSECLGFYADLIEKNYASEYEYTTSILELSNLEIVGNIYENPELMMNGSEENEI